MLTCNMVRFILSGVLLLIAGHLSTQAAVPMISLVSNLGNAEAEQVFSMPNYPVYQSFQVGPSAATIFSVNIAFGYVANPTGVQVSLFSDSSSVPGTSLGTFSLSGPPASISLGTPTFTGSFNVTANTRYWLEIATLGDPSNQSWVSYTSNSAETGEAGWSIGDTFLYDGGWASSGSIRMTVSGVPEPSATTLLGLGLGVVAWRRRR